MMTFLDLEPSALDRVLGGNGPAAPSAPAQPPPSDLKQFCRQLDRLADRRSSEVISDIATACWNATGAP